MGDFSLDCRYFTRSLHLLKSQPLAKKKSRFGWGQSGLHALPFAVSG
jgi:hypothetical protein